MSARNLKHDRQVALIDRIYHIYDALHAVDVSDAISPDIRAEIVNNLRLDIEAARSSLESIDKLSEEEASDPDENFSLFSRVELS